MTDRQEFEELFRSTYSEVVAYCRRRLGTDDWEDAVSDIYRIAWQQRKDFLEARKPIAWLMGVGFNVVSSEYRTHSKRRRLRDRLKAVPDPRKTTPETETVAQEQRTQLFGALSRLDPIDQEILRLAKFDELPYEQIAEVLGLTEPAVRTRVYRARKQLRIEFDAIGGEQL